MVAQPLQPMQLQTSVAVKQSESDVSHHHHTSEANEVLQAGQVNITQRETITCNAKGLVKLNVSQTRGHASNVVSLAHAPSPSPSCLQLVDALHMHSQTVSNNAVQRLSLAAQ